MALTWAVGGLLEAEKKLRCINGYADISTLFQALRQRPFDNELFKENDIASHQHHR